MHIHRWKVTLSKRSRSPVMHGWRFSIGGRNWTNRCFFPSALMLGFYVTPISYGYPENGLHAGPVWCAARRFFPRAAFTPIRYWHSSEGAQAVFFPSEESALKAALDTLIVAESTARLRGKSDDEGLGLLNLLAGTEEACAAYRDHKWVFPTPRSP